MKVVLDIETVQASREEWARLVGKSPEGHGPVPGEAGYDLFTAGVVEEAIIGIADVAHVPDPRQARGDAGQVGEGVVAVVHAHVA